jgi:pyruvate/2-oxoglutarate dehydrogenase complex dihydrolipoamide acyltransferase (E2) component
MCTGAEVALLATMAGSTAIQVSQQKKLSDFQADQANANADAEKQAGELRAEKARERAKHIAASARAALAASGIDLDSVSANLINKDIVERGEKDAFVQELNAEDRATALRQQADVFNLQGDQAVVAGVANLSSSAISTGVRKDGSWYGMGG